MRNPSWCTPEQSLHHLCKQSTHCFFQELISSWVSGCQACALSKTCSERGGKAREEDGTENISWLTPPSKPRSSPRHFHFAFCKSSVSCSIKRGWLQSPNTQKSVKQEEATDTLDVSLKEGEGRIIQENIPHYYFIPSSLKITLSPLSFLLGAFDLNVGIPMVSRESCPWH